MTTSFNAENVMVQLVSLIDELLTISTFNSPIIDSIYAEFYQYATTPFFNEGWVNWYVEVTGVTPDHARQRAIEILQLMEGLFYTQYRTPQPELVTNLGYAGQLLGFNMQSSFAYLGLVCSTLVKEDLLGVNSAPSMFVNRPRKGWEVNIAWLRWCKKVRGFNHIDSRVMLNDMLIKVMDYLESYLGGEVSPSILHVLNQIGGIQGEQTLLDVWKDLQKIYFAERWIVSKTQHDLLSVTKVTITPSFVNA